MAKTEGTNNLNALRQKGCATSGVNLGGIGTGGVELWPDGRFYFWNMVNSRPWASYEKHGNSHSIPPITPAVTDTDFFIRIRENGKRPTYRWLFTGHGLQAGTASHFYRHHKYFFIKSFWEIEYRAEYPFVYLTYIDPQFPVELKLRAWTSFIPRDVKNSSLPGAYFDFTIKNKGKVPLDISLVWQQQNLAGYAAQKIEQRHSKKTAAGAELVRMEGSLAEPEHDSSGDMSIWVLPRGEQKPTSISGNPYMQNLIWPIHLSGNLEGPMMPERIKREEINASPREGAPNKGWLCIQDKLEPGGSTEFNFGLSWFFPNHRSVRGTRVGHAYENWFSNSAEVAEYMIVNRTKLLKESLLLPETVMASGLPDSFKLSLLDQLNTLTKSTHFIKNGRIGLQEGHGCCSFNTVDVDHYSSYALALLFPELRKKILEMHTELAHPENGKIHHGLPGTVEEVPAGGTDGYSRWDVCCQYALQVYRDTKWAGDPAALKACWPAVKKAVKLVSELDFYGIGLPYIEGGITYDHWDMRGVVGFMAGVYLAALLAVEDMAKVLGDAETERWSRELFEKGRKGFETYLWNGEQYTLFYGRRPKGWRPEDETRGEKRHFEAQRPPEEFCGTPESCCTTACGCERPKPYMEIKDTGVMTDLLNGNATAAVMGLGAFLDPERVKKQLKLIMDKNYQPENDCVVNGSYPDEHFLDEWPFMQWQTPWTGTEYFYALQLYAAGMVGEGDKVIDMVYNRHIREGMRFDHAECNNHYARPLCIWGAYMARLGLDYDGYRNKIAFNPPGGTGAYNGGLVLSNALGRLKYSLSAKRAMVEISIKDGVLPVEILDLKPVLKAGGIHVRLNGQVLKASLVQDGRGGTGIRLHKKIVLGKGDVLSVG
ncbi:MAG: GH116 family glycosyl hydrolase [Bacillota bacterium]